MLQSPEFREPALIYTIVAKATLRCNFRCGYCYSSDPRGARMSPKILDDLLHAAAELEADVINIVWHGGEPLLAGLDFFKRAVKKQRELSDAAGVIFLNALQTNGSLVTDDWTEFFAEHKFNIGVSLDGPASIHDAKRPGVAGRASYKPSLSGFKALRAAGLFPGILSVVDPVRPPLAQEFFQWLSDLEFPSLTVSPMFGNRAASATRYAKFIADLLAQLRAVGRVGTVREAHTMKRRTRGGAGIWDACHPGWPCHESTSAVDPEGNIYFACDRFMDGLSAAQYRVGHVRTTGFRNIGASVAFRSLADEASKSRRDCDSKCEYAQTCAGGCIADWMLSPSMNAALRPHVAFCEGVAAAHAVLET